MFFKIVLFLSFFFFKNNLDYNPVDSGVIEIGYLGDTDKPYNKIIFNLPGSIMDSTKHDVFVYYFEVTPNEFEKIKRTIESCKFEGLVFIPQGQYYFMVSHNGDNEKFLTSYTEPSVDIFQKICFIILDSIKRKKIKGVFNQTLRRLGCKSELL